jgi:hypothetical protein
MATYDIEVASDLYDAGKDEEGRPFYAEVYYVVAEDDDGNRLRHKVSFPGALRMEGHDFVAFHDVRKEALAKAERLAARVRAACLLDSRYWSEIDPAYGSKAYLAYGQHNEVMRERAAEGLSTYFI